MTITKVFINRLVEALNSSSELRTHGTAKIVEDDDEYIIRYKDLNDYTNSIYFALGDDECHVGYLDHDGKYHWFATMRDLSTRNESTFMLDMAICLHRMGNYIIEEQENIVHKDVYTN